MKSRSGGKTRARPTGVVSSDHVLSHLIAMDGTRRDERDSEWIEWMAERVGEHKWWILRRVPIRAFRFGDERSARQVRFYADMPASTMPAIVAVQGSDGRYETIDGEHRLQAAYLREDKTVLAYVPYARTSRRS